MSLFPLVDPVILALLEIPVLPDNLGHPEILGIPDYLADLARLDHLDHQ